MIWKGIIGTSLEIVPHLYFNALDVLNRLVRKDVSFIANQQTCEQFDRTISFHPISDWLAPKSIHQIRLQLLSVSPTDNLNQIHQFENIYYLLIHVHIELLNYILDVLIWYLVK